MWNSGFRLSTKVIHARAITVVPSASLAQCPKMFLISKLLITSKPAALCPGVRSPAGAALGAQQLEDAPDHGQDVTGF